jgi:SAM-dependent methyltransferase
MMGIVTDDYREILYSKYVSTHLPNCAVGADEYLRGRAPYLLGIVQRHFPADRNAQILDVGCGHGALVYFAVQAGYRNCRGVDASAEQVALAERLGIPGVSLGGLSEKMQDQSDESLDVVAAFDVIEHLTKEELLALLEQVHRTLRPGGRLVLHTPNAASPFFGKIRYGDFTHEQAFTSSSLGQVLRVFGFSEIACYEDAPVVHGMTSLVRRSIWTAWRSMLAVALAAETGQLRGHILSQNFLVTARRGA